MCQKIENKSFVCENCGKEVKRLTNGSFRNHCPFCLYSKHVDIIPGDRMNDCKCIMKPIGLKFKSGKGLQLVHKCLKCGAVNVNKVAEDTSQPDEILLYSQLPMLRLRENQLIE